MKCEGERAARIILTLLGRTLVLSRGFDAEARRPLIISCAREISIVLRKLLMLVGHEVVEVGRVSLVPPNRFQKRRVRVNVLEVVPVADVRQNT